MLAGEVDVIRETFSKKGYAARFYIAIIKLLILFMTIVCILFLLVPSALGRSDPAAQEGEILMTQL